MDEPSHALPRSRAKLLRDLNNLLHSMVTVPLTVTVQSPYGTQTFPLPPLPFADPETDPPPDLLARLPAMQRDLLAAAAESAEPLTANELAKRAGYSAASVRPALAALRRDGLLGGNPGTPGYPINQAGRQVLGG